jgi:hypothetical protein
MDKKNISSRQPELKELKDMKLDLKLKSFGDGPTYNIYYLLGVHEEPGRFMRFWPVVEDDLDVIRRKDIEYIVFNNMMMSDKAKALYNKIKEISRPVAVFNPYNKDENFRETYDTKGITSLPVSSKELFSRKKTGPYLVIYRIR